MKALGILAGLRERVAGGGALELAARQHEDARLEAMTFRDGCGEPRRYAISIGHRTSKDRVAALNVRLHVDAAAHLEHQLELLHWQQVTATDVDAAE